MFSRRLSRSSFWTDRLSKEDLLRDSFVQCRILPILNRPLYLRIRPKSFQSTVATKSPDSMQCLVACSVCQSFEMLTVLTQSNLILAPQNDGYTSLETYFNIF